MLKIAYFLCLVPQVLGALNLTYDELSIMKRDCFPSDSCQMKNVETASRYVRLLDDFKDRACNCDDLCVEFEDCCIDAKPRTRLQNVGPNNQNCIELKNYGSIFMVDNCPADWNDQVIRKNCENITSTSPFSQFPVTDLRIGKTFRNYYCAICNHHTSENEMQMWKSRIECTRYSRYKIPASNNWPNFTRGYILENIHYNETNQQWGLISDSKFYRCEIDPFLPDNIQHTIRYCRQAKADCPPSWPDDEVREKCSAYNGVVHAFGDPFKNVHCAICNGFSPSNVTCGASGVAVTSRNNAMNSFGSNPFSVLMDFNPNQGELVGVISRCQKGEVYDPFFRVCRDIICGLKNYVVRNGQCTQELGSVNDQTSISDFVNPGNNSFEGSGNNTIPVTRSKSNSSEKELEDLDCPFRWKVSAKHVMWLKNDSIFIKKYKMMFDRGEYLRMEKNNVLICALDVPEQVQKFSFNMTIVTLTGMGISIVCLILHLLVFLLVPDLQNLSGKNLSCLVLALLVGYVSFILGMFFKPSSLSCLVISVLTYYSFLANFFWMNVIAFDVWQTLRMATTELRVSGGRQLRKFVFYSLYAWGSPAICVTIAMMMEYSIIPALPSYRPAFGLRSCWFGHRMALAVLFGGPVGGLLILNIILFCLSSAIILWSTRNATKYSSPTSSSRRSYKLYLRLAIICGLTWTWGFAAGFFNHEPLWFMFILFNTLIGFFIFATFTCTKKVKLSLKDRLKRWKKVSKKNELFNISASTGSNLNSNETRKSALIPTDSGGSNISDGMYNPLASYKTNSTMY